MSSLVAKGYVQKTVPEEDRREVRLQTCGKFNSYFEEQSERLTRAIESLTDTYSSEQLSLVAEVLDTLVGRVDIEEA